MAPRNNAALKSYSRNTSSKRSKLDVLHNITTKPIEKKKSRRKPKLKIKELPPPPIESCLSHSNSSLKLNRKCENTFDKLLNATNYNQVNYKSILKKTNSSESSLSILQVKPQSSPIRQKRTKWHPNRSPVFTRSYSSRIENSSSNDEDKKVKTLERSVNESLYIEKVKVIQQNPTINFGDTESDKSSIALQGRDGTNESSMNSSYEPIFSKTFHEKYNNHNLCSRFVATTMSSTPVVPIINEKIINESIISPIVGIENNKFEGSGTPKLKKRGSKIRRSILTKSINCNSSGSNDENKENVEENKDDWHQKNEIESATCEKSMAIYKGNNVEDMSKLFQSAIVNITTLNPDSCSIRNAQIPLANLTNIDIRSFYQSVDMVYNKKNILMKLNGNNVAIVNITKLNADEYLSKDDCCCSNDKFEDSRVAVVQQPFVNITNTNLEGLLSLKHMDFSNVLAIDSLKSNDIKGSRVIVDQNSNKNKRSISSDVFLSDSDGGENGEKCLNGFPDDVLSLRNSSEEDIGINIDENAKANDFVGVKRVNEQNVKDYEKNSVCESVRNRNSKMRTTDSISDLSNLKLCFDQCEDSQSKDDRKIIINDATDTSECECSNSSEMSLNQSNTTSGLKESLNDLIHDILSKNFNKPVVNLTNINIQDYLTMDGTLNDKNIDQSLENRFKSPKTADSSLEQSKLEHIIRSSGVGTNRSNLIFDNKKDSPISYITLRRRRVPRSAPRDHKRKMRNTGEHSKCNSLDGQNVTKINVSNCEVGGDGSAKLIKNVNLDDKATDINEDKDQAAQFQVDRERECLIDISEITDSQNQQNLSPPGFRGFDIVEIANLQPQNSLKYISSPDRIKEDKSIVILDDKTLNKMDSSIIDSSYADVLDKDIKRTIFSLALSKRNRSSSFKQCTKSYKEESSKDGSLLIDMVENTPIKVTKRKKVHSTFNKRSVVDDDDFKNFTQTGTSVQIRLREISDNKKDEIEETIKLTRGFFSARTSTPISIRPSKSKKQSIKAKEVEMKLNLNKVIEESSSVIRDYAVSKDANSSLECILDQPARSKKVQPHPEMNKQCNIPQSDVFAVPKLPISKMNFKPKEEKEVVLKPGKLWRRSLLEARNSKIGLPLVKHSFVCVANKGDAVCTCAHCKKKIIEISTPKRLSVRVVPLQTGEDVQDKTRRNSVLENYAANYRKSYISNVLQESLLEECFENLSLTRERSILRPEEETYPHQEVTVTARDVVLRKCGQTEPLPFEKCYPNSVLQHCQKIGEGVYGEVFLFRRPMGGTSVIKVIPIEGGLIVNGERQKKFEEILSEITIAMELSELRSNAKNNTNGFTELRKVTCVKGKYPERLLDLWELFHESRGSENDHPDIFDDDQLYIVLELANGGKDMESFVFSNAQQAYALVTQVACALAVAESSLQFEHRDLHWGNILISNVNNDDTISLCLDGKNVTLDTYGVQIAIIDFTLSRISNDGVCIYNDLALDPDLFTATGDYQFELYRLMQAKNTNEWQHYEPYTNILWLDYVLDKAIKAVRYRTKSTKIHKKYLRELKELKDEVLQYKSAEDFVNAKFIAV